MSQSFFVDGQWIGHEAYVARNAQLQAEQIEQSGEDNTEQSGEDNTPELTKAQLIEKLTELGVEFSPSAKKAELKELLEKELEKEPETN